MPIDIDAPFKRSELERLARDILALDCSEKTQVHAEKMLLVKDVEYSRSFFEAATRIRELMSTGSSLEVAVKAVAGWVPSVEDIEFKLVWWDCDIVSVSKQVLLSIASEIEEYDIPSPDRGLATRISSKKASKEEWRLFALRYVDYKTRVSNFDFLLWDFCADINRAKKEFDALKPCIRRVCVTGDGFEVERSVMPPWRDTEYWEADLDEWGYGDDFSPSFEPQPSAELTHSSNNVTDHNSENIEVVDATTSTAIVPITEPTDAYKQVYTEDIVDELCSSDEDYEVAVLEDDIYEDQKMYEAMDEEKKKLLADAVNLPQKFRLENLPHRSAQEATGLITGLKKIQQSTTVLTEEEKEKRWAEAAMLNDAMKFNSFKEEVRAVEELMKKYPDGKIFDMACERLLDAAIEAEARENGVQERPKELCSTVIKSAPAQGNNVSLKDAVTDLNMAGCTVINTVPAQDNHGSQIVAFTGSDRASTSATVPAQDNRVQERPKENCTAVKKAQERPKENCTAVIKAVTAQDKQGSQIVAVTGSDHANTSATIRPAKGLPDHIDVNAFSQVFAPTVTEKIWPSLPSKKTAPTVQLNIPSKNLNVQPAKNVWVEKTKAKKTFMNAGIGGKLTKVLPTAPEFFIDVNKAHTIQDIWGYSLLGQYVGHNPGHHLIYAMIKGWGVRAKYKLEEGWFIFSFESEADRDKVLIGGPYLIHGRPMILKNIPDKFAFNKKDLALVPLWVRIYGLASRFWTTEILGGIASYVGSPMYMDPVTDSRKRNAYARVLVEINLAEPVSKAVPIKFSDGDTTEVNFLVENQPKFCTSCCSYGHVCNDCQFLAKKPITAAKNLVQKPAVTDPVASLPSRDKHHLKSPSPAAIRSSTAVNRVVEQAAVNTPGIEQHTEPPTVAIVLNNVDNGSLEATAEWTTKSGRNICQLQQVISPPEPTILHNIHSDVELANQFAALNEADIHTEMESKKKTNGYIEAPGHTSPSSDLQSNKQSLIISKGVYEPAAEPLDYGHLQSNTQAIIQEEDMGNLHKKGVTSTPTGKKSSKDHGNSAGPNTRSKMKQMKT